MVSAADAGFQHVVFHVLRVDRITSRPCAVADGAIPTSPQMREEARVRVMSRVVGGLHLVGCLASHTSARGVMSRLRHVQLRR
jgi:hypothetical protein